MPISWNEIRDRAVQFSRKWEGEKSEEAEAKSFLDDFFNVFGISRRRIASFEYKVPKVDGNAGFIDLLWKGKLLIEHKSRGKNLDMAYKQATDYFVGLKEAELPRYVLVCDFENFRLKDLDSGETAEFKLKDFPANIKHFGFIAGYETHTYKEQDPVNIQAAERMGKLHDELRDIGFAGHELEVFLVRLLFCLFAEDTGIFMPTGIFEEYIRTRTNEDGSDLAPKLGELFEILNTPENKRFKNLDEDLARFGYINGKLFSERLRTASFTSKMRQHLLDCCELNWSTISPAIFGALFQSIMDKTARRNLGAHYTSEKNILKLIKPLFLDALWEEFDKIRRSPQKLRDFQKKLRSLTFLDPACGCGNFLVIAYRELRLLEFEVLSLLHKEEQMILDLRELLLVNVDQFFGIELEEFPAQIAEVALWLVDHQMNTMVGARFGQHFARIPLTTSPTIVNDDALRLDWQSVVPKRNLSYILGNPPFVGKHYQNSLQREDQTRIMASIKSGSDLDHVACWFIRAAQFTRDTHIEFAFVATNSITQGEQVPLLWGHLFHVEKLKIVFAHRTFQWSNEAHGVAAVHCIIIGLSRTERREKLLFDYENPRSEPHEVKVSNISPYLTAGSDDFVRKQQKPLSNVPVMRCGSKPSDGGHLILDSEARASLMKLEPGARKWIRKYVGSDEFINAIPRWCLWLTDITPSQLKALPMVMGRVNKVRTMRLASTAVPTQRAAERPSQFFFVSQPLTAYIAVPEVSSERRKYVPMGLLTPDVISSNKIYIVPEPNKFLFGVLQSAMHMAWLTVVGGRLESRFQYSASMVYNTFPWPESPTAKQKSAVEQAAENVLDTRAKYPGSSLADLYDPLTMPADLLKAHQKLDKAVDAAYGKRTFATEAERVAYLFELYQKLTEPLMAGEGKKRKGKSQRKSGVA